MGIRQPNGTQCTTKKMVKEKCLGFPPCFIETSLFGVEYKGDGTYPIVGPCPYTARKWYAKVTVKDNIITKVE